MCAAYNGHTATAAELVRLGADINAKSNVRACEGAASGSTHRCVVACCRVADLRRTALTDAAEMGHTATAAELVRLGADINAKCNVRACGSIGVESPLLCGVLMLQDGRTALMYAAHVRCSPRQNRHGRRTRAAWGGHQREVQCTYPLALQLRAWVAAGEAACHAVSAAAAWLSAAAAWLSAAGHACIWAVARLPTR